MSTQLEADPSDFDGHLALNIRNMESFLAMEMLVDTKLYNTKRSSGMD